MVFVVVVVVVVVVNVAVVTANKEVEGKGINIDGAEELKTRREGRARHLQQLVLAMAAACAFVVPLAGVSK